MTSTAQALSPASHFVAWIHKHPRHGGSFCVDSYRQRQQHCQWEENSCYSMLTLLFWCHFNTLKNLDFRSAVLKSLHFRFGGSKNEAGMFEICLFLNSLTQIAQSDQLHGYRFMFYSLLQCELQTVHVLQRETFAGFHSHPTACNCCATLIKHT